MKTRLLKSGFSLIEILIAMVVLTIGIMGVLGALTFGLRSTDSSEKLGKALAIERKIMEEAMVVGAFAGTALKPSEVTPIQFNAPPYDNLFNGAGSTYTTDDYNNFQRQVEYFPLAGGEKVVAGSTWEATRVAKIRVTVLYRDRNNAQKRVQTFGYDRL